MRHFNGMRCSRSWGVALLAGLLVALAGCDDSGGGKTGETVEPDVPDEQTDDIVGADQTDQDAAVGADADAGPDIKKPDTTGGSCETDKDCEGKDKGSLTPCEKWICATDIKTCIAVQDVGKACDDGKACTSNDKCPETGACIGTESCQQDPSKPCEVNACDDTGKCAFTKKSSGSECDDGNACTEGDVCVGTTCAGGKAKACASDGDPCTLDTCDPLKGCDYPQAPTGTDCEDGNLCTEQGKCSAQGKCEGTEVKCKDMGPCGTNTCDPAQGCIFQPANPGASCNDGDSCTVDDKCTSQGCNGKADPSVDDGNPCTKDVPSGSGAVCNVQHVPTPGATCEDSDPCTKSDTCDQTGQCTLGQKLVCNDGNACTEDACDPKKCDVTGKNCGQCAYSNSKDGTPCDDNTKCTDKDNCQIGKCKGTAVVCDDKNPCTGDICLDATGCSTIPTDPKQTKFCDDGDPCTTIDKCTGSACKGSTKDCKDTNPCTNDSCDAKSGECKHAEFDGPCEDGDKCTKDDVCQDGACNGSAVTCDDGNPCTVDLCDSIKGCQNKPVQGGTQCDDGLSCTVNDYCDAGKCVAQIDQCEECNGSDLACKPKDDNDLCNGQWKCVSGLHPTKKAVCTVDPKTIVNCDASNDNECSKNACNPDTGTCAMTYKAEGTPCATGDKCVSNATCSQAGKCEGTQADCDDKEPCTVDSCNAKLGCLHSAVKDGEKCDDGSACTPDFGDLCKAGKCQNAENTCNCTADQDCVQYDDGNLCNGVFKCIDKGAGKKFCEKAAKSEVVCPALPNEPCKSNTCEPSTGQCKAVAKSDGGTCNDSNACSVGETCTAGVCASTKKLECNDDNPCTVDVCDKVFGCANAPLAQGGLCNDGDACTSKDTCSDGKCKGQKVNCDDGNACTVDTCAKVGGCISQVDNTLTCDDGDPCSTPDVCKDGNCSGTPLKCDDGNPCTIDACDGKGGCKNVVVEGKDCSDGDVCTVSDTCVGGKCVGKAKSCDDGNFCTNDSCQNGACVITPAVGQNCDDSNACTTEDKCDLKGACTGKVAVCDSKTPCITDLGCVATKGCVTAPNDGAKCSDNDMCTINDTCAGGGCQGIKLDCNDNSVCTTDLCDAKLGCQIKQNTCDDQNPCTVDTCDTKNGCQHEPVDGSACEDGDKCTEKGQCQQGKCVSKAVTCDDKNSCTIDSCDPSKGCVALAGEDTAVTCDDNNPCTDTSCVSGECVPTDKKCDDGNPCTIDSCNALKGCVVEDAQQGATCDDGDECTDKTVCQGGICSGGTVKAGCGICETDKDCDLFDNGNKCDGKRVCKMSDAKGFKLCYEEPDPIVCDTTGDSQCSKNTCNPLTGTCAMKEALNGATCDDGVGCTAGDACYNGACQAGPPVDCSKSADACNEAKCVENPDKTGGYECVATPKEGAVACDADGTGCTADDYCDAGKCIKGTPVDCSGVAGACQVALCKSSGPQSFECAVSMAVDGTPCDDGQLCTDGDFCKTGKCQPGTKPHDCSEVASACASGTCDKAGNGGLGACVPKPINEGSPCDSDQNGCTVGDKCVAGACVPGAPPDCNASSTDCAVGACKSSNANQFQCIGAPRPDKLPCEYDNNGCTVGDACKAGKCTAGVAMDCSSKTSQDGCLVGTCKSLSSSSGTCVPQPAPVGQPCNSDSNGCTKGDACNKDGACLPGPAVDCLAFSGSCSQGSCQSTGAATFTCVGNPKPDGTACDGDQNGCTVGDACKAGKCVAGSAADCSDKAGVCLTGGCINAGSDKYQCDALPLKDGTPCDADKDGCTVDDSCQLGFCDKGQLQTCSQFSGLCADAACKSTGSNTFTCDVTPKESFKPLDPPVACTPTDKPPKCDLGYTCEVTNQADNLGTCVPTKTVYCDDKNLCTEGDVCSAGKCTAGTNKDCDDKDPCTLDSCSAGKCSNQAVAGCVACIKEDYDEPVAKGWAIRADDAKYATWKNSAKKPFAGTANMRVEWVGPYAGDQTMPQMETTLAYRKMYIESKLAPQLDFYVSMTVGNQDCGKDDLILYINGIKAWEKCASTTQAEMEDGSTYQHITIDLSKFAGAPADFEFKVIAGIEDKATGTIDIDNVRLTGACGPGCLGVDFEPRPGGTLPDEDPLAATVPQPWVMTSTNDTYVKWTVTDKSTAHTGAASLIATYAGAPASAKPETARLLIPMIRAEAGDKLFFSIKATGVGDGNCGTDDLIVKVAGKEVYKRCNIQSTWKEEVVDLPAGATSDVEILVITGGGAGSKGTFEIDDIAVAGKCMYACYHANLDNGTLNGFSSSTFTGWTAPAAQKWILSKLEAKSPEYSVYAGYVGDTKSTTGALASLSAKQTFVLPILGAVWSWNINSFVKTPDCTKGAVNFLRFHTLATQATKQADLQGDKDGNITLDTLCESTQGWEFRKGEFFTEHIGKRGRMNVTMAKTISDTAKTYVDDLIVMCR